MATKDIPRPIAPAFSTHRKTDLRKDALCIALVSFLVLLSWVPRARGPIDLRWDAGVYFVLGTSLAQGDGYRLLNEPGNIKAIQYPPGLPAIVALHEALLKSIDPLLVGLWLRRSFFVLSVLYAIGAFLLGRVFMPRRYALLLSAACVLNYQMYFLQTLCFAELPFAVCSVLFGYLYFKPNKGRAARILTPVAAIASYLMRTIGIAVLIAWIAEAALRKQFRQAALRAAISLVPVLLWQTYIHSVESSDNYKHPSYAYQRDSSLFYNVSYSTNVALKSPFQPEQGLATRSDMLVRVFQNAVTMPSYLAEAITAKEGFWTGHLTRINRSLRVITLPPGSIQLVIVPLGLIVIGSISFLSTCCSLSAPSARPPGRANFRDIWRPRNRSCWSFFFLSYSKYEQSSAIALSRSARWCPFSPSRLRCSCYTSRRSLAWSAIEIFVTRPFTTMRRGSGEITHCSIIPVPTHRPKKDSSGWRRERIRMRLSQYRCRNGFISKQG